MKIGNWRVEFKNNISRMPFDEVKYWRFYVVHREKYKHTWCGEQFVATRMIIDHRSWSTYTLDELKQALGNSAPWLKGQYVIAYPRKTRCVRTTDKAFDVEE